MFRWCLVVLLAGCGRLSFDPIITPAHLPDLDPCAGELTLSSLAIDTSLDAFPVPLPAGASYRRVTQPGTNADVAVVCVGSLIVESGAVVAVGGSLPLVFVAEEAAIIDGIIDGGGKSERPGPGGGASGMGAGGGTDGSPSAPPDLDESGGSGAGYATDGGRGGGTTLGLPPTAGGTSYGEPDLAVELVGGSGGGAGIETSGCVSLRAGAGGGGLQISAPTIAIGAGGGISVGGGGGAGGVSCNTNAGSGAGGGSGGAIYLEARTVANAGVLAANGGAGGSGGDDTVPGSPGEDGGLTAAPAVGGLATLVKGGAGGRGGGGADPEDGALGTGNAGGGGGSAGRIVIAGELDVVGVISPAPVQVR